MARVMTATWLILVARLLFSSATVLKTPWIPGNGQRALGNIQNAVDWERGFFITPWPGLYEFMEMDGRLFSPNSFARSFKRLHSDIVPCVTVQQVTIPQAILGNDVLCQAKSGLGKTAVFVLATLQQMEEKPEPGVATILVMCHTRELAYQIKNEYNRFAKFLPDVKVGVFYGGTPVQKDIEILSNKETHPHIIVGTPGRINALVRDKKLRLANLKHFVLDECDKMLDQPGQ
jgi:hypothetical protein